MVEWVFALRSGCIYRDLAERLERFRLITYEESKGGMKKCVLELN